jgi:hypothetical protein
MVSEMHDGNGRYSVWNWRKGQYDYYRVNRPLDYRARVGYPAPKSLKGVGEVPEQAVDPLPADASFVGSGEQAIGIISAPQQRSAVLFIAAALAGLWLLR